MKQTSKQTNKETKYYLSNKQTILRSIVLVVVVTNDPTHHWPLLAKRGLQNKQKLRNIGGKREKGSVLNMF